MEQLLVLLVLWFVIDILGGNSKNPNKNKNRSSKEELQQRQLEDLHRSQQAERRVAANRRRMQQQNRPQTKTIVFGDLGDFFREFADLMNDEAPASQPEATPAEAEQRPAFSEMTKEDIARRKRELREKRSHRLNRAKPAVAMPADDECEYCTGEAEIESTITRRSAPAKTIVLDENRNTRDVAAACRELQLNPLQQAVVWAEVLDKPLALRKRR